MAKAKTVSFEGEEFTLGRGKGAPRLTPPQEKAIKRGLDKGMTAKEISETVGVSPGTISRIRNDASVGAAPVKKRSGGDRMVEGMGEFPHGKIADDSQYKSEFDELESQYKELKAKIDEVVSQANALVQKAADYNRDLETFNTLKEKHGFK